MNNAPQLSDEVIGELFRSLVLKALEDADPRFLHDVFHGQRDGSDERVLAGLKKHNDAKHANIQALIGMVGPAKGQPVPQPTGQTPRLPSGKPDVFAGTTRAANQIFSKK